MTDTSDPAPTWLDLYDYRLQVAAIYRERARALAAGEDEQVVLEQFRSRKNVLFAMHPQSPFVGKERDAFAGLLYFPYDPDFRTVALLKPISDNDEPYQATEGEHPTPLRRAARVTFALAGDSHELTVYWIDIYGGGLLLPFRDATCPDESYGGGRYLFDTVKGSDFLRLPDDAPEGRGFAGGRIVLDFNYAYNPSCAYDPRWSCPLAPRENWLTIHIRAGERKYHG